MKAQISAATRQGAIGWMLWNADVVYNWGVFGKSHAGLDRRAETFRASTCETARVAALTAPIQPCPRTAISRSTPS